MVITVVVINLLVSCFCFYAAWQIWKLRRTLAQVANALTASERSTHSVLYGAPTGILQGQRGVNQLRQQYQKLELQLQKVQQVLGLISLGQGVWRQQVRRSQRPRMPKKRF
ncbi:hypothetical protein H6F90_19325 [Trichocoleus sp. FACHB-591]|uniref:hypothetical protein n=1 Tax=Trichocoleus sp. FACHB-591 TaxID=2692872 RepID=UPI001689C4EE|nr:hypothetical protein [Trichocoleus sp. FACHB-591]MBD2097255.1 hypothetical protein [Trichocoleus sp. FACHB-591]